MTKAPVKKTQTEPTVSISAQALSAAIEECNKLFAHMRARVGHMENEAVGLVNDALQLGFYFQEATGRNQLEFFLFQNIEEQLDKGLHFQLAQAAVSLVNRYGRNHRFKTYAEAQNELQPLLRGMNVIAAHKRAEQLPGQRENPDQWLSTVFADVRVKYEKMFANEPLQGWPAERLDTFIFQTQKIHDDHDEAKRLRDGGLFESGSN